MIPLLEGNPQDNFQRLGTEGRAYGILSLLKTNKEERVLNVHPQF